MCVENVHAIIKKTQKTKNQAYICSTNGQHRTAQSALIYH